MAKWLLVLKRNILEIYLLLFFIFFLLTHQIVVVWSRTLTGAQLRSAKL